MMQTNRRIYFFCHFTPPSSAKKDGIARGLFERSEFRSARLFRAAQGNPLKADQVNGCTFFGSFLYTSKEMNVNKFKIIYTLTLLCLTPIYPHSIAGTHQPSW